MVFLLLYALELAQQRRILVVVGRAIMLEVVLQSLVVVLYGHTG
jgi:hypothetical protein